MKSPYRTRTAPRRSQQNDPLEFDEMLRRIQDVTTKTTQVGLAEVLGIRQSSISDAKKRGSIPADWLLTLYERYQVNPTWIKKGTGSRYLTGAEVSPEVPDPDSLRNLSLRQLCQEILCRFLPEDLSQEVADRLYIKHDQFADNMRKLLGRILPGDLVGDVMRHLAPKIKNIGQGESEQP